MSAEFALDLLMLLTGFLRGVTKRAKFNLASIKRNFALANSISWTLFFLPRASGRVGLVAVAFTWVGSRFSGKLVDRRSELEDLREQTDFEGCRTMFVWEELQRGNWSFSRKKSEDENNMSYITLFLEDTRANWESPSDINEESGWRKTFPIFLLPSHEHTHWQIPPGCCYLFGFFFRRTSIFFTAGAEPNKTVNKRCFSYLCSRMALGKGEKWLEVDTWKGFFSGKILLP